MMSPLFQTIKRYFALGLYDNDITSPRYVGQFVKANWITPEEYKLITNTDYEENAA